MLTSRLPLASACVLLAALAGCPSASNRGGTSPPHPTAAPLPPLPPALRSPHDSFPPSATTFRDDDSPALTPPDRRQHLLARDAARAGRLYEAKRILAHLAMAYLNEPLFVEQYNAVVAQISERQAAAKAALEQAPLRSLPAPPVTYVLLHPAPVTGPPLPTLAKVSDKRNAITDQEEWFTKNDIRSPEFFVPPARDVLFAPGAVASSTVVNTLTGFVYSEYVPAPRYLDRTLVLEVPLSYGTIHLARAIDSPPYVLALYGDTVVAVFDATQGYALAALFDLTNYAHPPEKGTLQAGNVTIAPSRAAKASALLLFAAARDGVLYVSHAYNGYRKDADALGAYVTAIDLTSGDLLWRTVPLVAPGNAFALVGSGLVFGCAFRTKPDFVCVLDRATGVIKQKVAVRSGVENVIAKDDRVFVRTYDTDVILSAH